MPLQYRCLPIRLSVLRGQNHDCSWMDWWIGHLSLTGLIARESEETYLQGPARRSVGDVLPRALIQVLLLEA